MITLMRGALTFARHFALGLLLLACVSNPVSAGAITNPVVRLGGALDVDVASWSINFDCASDTLKVRGTSVAAGTFRLSDSPDFLYPIRTASVARSGTESISWDIPFAQLRVDDPADPNARNVTLYRVGHRQNLYSIVGMSFSTQAACRGAQTYDLLNDDYVGQIAGRIPDTVKKGRKYRLPDRMVTVSNPALPAGVTGQVSYQVRTQPINNKTRACRIVREPLNPRKYRQFLVGLKPGRECLLSGDGLVTNAPYGRGLVATGLVALIKVTR